MRIGPLSVFASVSQRKGVKLKEILEHNHINASDNLRHKHTRSLTHTRRGEKVIKEAINHREQSQREITLPLSKHCSYSALLAGVLLSPRLQILASSLKIITEIVLHLPEVPGQLWEMLST